MALAPQAASQIGNSQFVIFDQFEKMNTKVARQSLPAKQVSWIENLQPIAANDLQAVPGPAPVLKDYGTQTGSRLFPANIGGIDYVIFFTTAGAGNATDTSNGNSFQFAPPGTFS